MGLLADFKALFYSSYGSNDSDLAPYNDVLAFMDYSYNPGMLNKMVSGQYYYLPNSVVTGTTVALNAVGSARSTPFYIPNRVTLTRLGIGVATAGTATNVLRLGIYSANPDTGLPKTLLVDAGTIDGTSATSQEVTINLTLEPGLYWFIIAAQVASGGTIRACTQIPMNISLPSGSNGVKPNGTSTVSGPFFTTGVIAGAFPADITSLIDMASFGLTNESPRPYVKVA